MVKLQESQKSPYAASTGRNRDKIIFWLKMIICCILFILTIALQKNTQISSGIKGTIAEIQMCISVYLALSCKKTGYFVASVINLILIVIILKVIIDGDLSALPGVFSYVNTLIVATLLYKLYTRLNLKIIQVSKNENVLSKQNLKLREYNKIMEDNKAQLNYMANYDYLTDLPNRKMIINRIQQLIEQKEKFAVVFIDLDNFKNINDTMGHEIGDSVLITISNKLKNIICTNDIAGRLGGDELALIIRNIENQDDIYTYLKNIKEAVYDSLEIRNSIYKVTASYGVAVYPKNGESANELLNNADTAMYKAKAIGENYIKFFNKEMKDEVLNMVAIKNNLKEALVNDEIYLVFQPQYTTINKKLKGFEVLVRWNSKELGFIPPLKFIKIAEETGFIIDLGYWIFDKSLKSLNKWKKGYNTDIKLSINISYIQVMDIDFVKNIKKLLEENGVKGEDIILEITESIFISSMDYVLDVLNQLKALGVSIALDDFGTGYSSLSYLNSLPIDLLKIDKSFIDNINKTDKQNALISSIIELSKALGIEVVAEGVETEEQLLFLKDHDCRYIQGYLWGKPINELEVEKIII